MKKIAAILFLSVITLLITGKSASAANNVDIKDNGDGTVTVNYINTAEKTIAVQVQQTGSNVKYNYFCMDKKVDVDIPLTQGNGEYTIMVLKQTSGSKYARLDSRIIDLNLKDEKSAFLTSCQIIDWDSKNAAIKEASKLTKSSKDDYDKIKKIYKYIVENYSYDYDKLKELKNISNYIPDINDVYKSKKGICYDIASLNASMLRSIEIETQLVKGYPTNPVLPENTYHAWNKVYNSKTKKWIIVDATTDMQLYEKVDYKAMEKKKSQYSNETYVY